MASLEGWPRAMGLHVYMLRCADNSFYVGSATGDDLGPRVEQHNAGAFRGYTSKRCPVLLVWSEYFDRISDGVAVERQMKGWSRAKKEALIRGNWDAIGTLASRRAGRAKSSQPILRGSAKTPSASG